QLKCGLAIQTLNGKLFKQLDTCRSTCFCHIFGGSPKFAVKLILRLNNQTTMQEHTQLL
ncbi:uncharacterized protein BX663DRAFT_443597, partial [Cokeromyces recurvatus]|uniref:uncharacterized protein n=1 Tax=Cokeromyces recurvatus TaxID=90255 RepID=UPI00221EF049